MSRHLKLTLTLAATAALAVAAWATFGLFPGAGDASSGGVRLVRIGSFDEPVFVTAPPGDRKRVFVVEISGRIRVVRKGRTLSRPFLDISRSVLSGGEQGLLSMAFAPDYATSRRFYVYFTNRGGDTRVVEYRRSRRSRDRASAGSARVVLKQSQPEENHNGGQLQFGPDGLLYVGLGDGGGGGDQHGTRGNGQDRGTLLGKILRIDPRPNGGRPYRIPADNPFAGRSGMRGEIYAWGLRNPWRFSFDRETGDITIGDVGQGEVEEIDFASRGQARGANYGWRVFEGDRRFTEGESAPGAVSPVFTYTHGDGGCSITGGYVSRDPALPSLGGRYVYGDYCRGDLRSVRLRPGGSSGDRGLGLHVDRLTSFGEDAGGRLYAASHNGPVYRLAPR